MMALSVVFATVLGAIGSIQLAQAVDISSCEEFAALDRKTETLVTITTADFKCDEYTRLSIKSAEMVLSSSVGPVTFSNLALHVFGSLTVEPDVEFTGIEAVGKNGGALKVGLGASAVFEGTTKFTDVSVMTVQLADDEEKEFKGAAIHNKGDLRFKKDSTFTGCLNDRLSESDYGSGPGGALSNHVKGTIHFEGNLIMEGNEANDYYGGAEGGAIFNRGDITVDGDATFNNNVAGNGGAIYQEQWATFSVAGFTTFFQNKCFDTWGGAVANFGGDMSLLGGSKFDDNFAENSGDGGVGGGIYNYNGGNVVLEGSATFSKNYGNWGGGIFNQVTRDIYLTREEDTFTVPTITYPDDTVFEDNYGQYCNDIAFEYDEETCGL